MLFKRVHPVLPVREVSAAIAYYTEKLGFRRVFQDVPDAPRYASIERDGVQLHLQWHDSASFRDRVDTIALRFLIEEVEALFTEYRLSGAVSEKNTISDTAWGTREFAFYDPDGNGLFFYQSL